jgi:hypothetical protein
LSRWLIVSDLQIPFEAEHALDFCKTIAKELRVPLKSQDLRQGGVICVGDELDNYWASAYPKSPEARHTARTEFQESYERIREWRAAFPHMWICTSNHGDRWDKRADDVGIPLPYRKHYSQALDYPKTWKIAKRWIVPAKHRFQAIHGVGYSSMYAYRMIPLHQGISTVFGHLHSSAGVAHISPSRDGDGDRWGMNVGSLVNREAYAFKYGADNQFKEILSAGAVVDDGLTPLLFRYNR